MEKILDCARALRHRGRDPGRHARGVRRPRGEPGVLMSYVPATSNRDMLAVAVIAVVAVIGHVHAARLERLRVTHGRRRPARPHGRRRERTHRRSLGKIDDDESAEVVAVTSDGWAFMPDGDEVQLVPLASAEGGEETDPTDAINATAMLPHPRHRHLPIAQARRASRRRRLRRRAGRARLARLRSVAAGGAGPVREYRSWHSRPRRRRAARSTCS